jgi:glycolate oxidase FAD binding subunit
MEPLCPQTAGEVAEILACAAKDVKTIGLGGRFTKNRMAGPVAPADVLVSTAALQRVLKFEPRDLTISVEAGLPFAELCRILDEHQLMIPLDPPFATEATTGGVVASNLSGPRRRLYGTARDMVIGMRFATLEGKLVDSGGMVVKNVAGLDMSKLMIGSFGTLAAITHVNFKLVPKPARSRTFLMAFDSLEAAVEMRDAVHGGVLQPVAMDLLNAKAAELLQRAGHVLAIQAGGNPAVIERYSRELPQAEALDGEQEAAFWRSVQDFTPRFLRDRPEGAVVRVSTLLAQLKGAMKSMRVPALARAGSGICYGYFPDADQAASWISEAAKCGWHGIVEFAPEARKAALDLWPQPGSDYEIMKRVKGLFDPGHLLNRGRLYGRI